MSEKSETIDDYGKVEKDLEDFANTLKVKAMEERKRLLSKYAKFINDEIPLTHGELVEIKYNLPEVAKIGFLF